jgi:hypothetical protein
MAIDFRKLLKPETQQKMADADEHYARDLFKFRNLSDKNLVATARYYLSQMKEPWKYEFSTPTYDAAFYYIVVPELLRRIEDGLIRLGDNEVSGMLPKHRVPKQSR